MAPGILPGCRADEEPFSLRQGFQSVVGSLLDIVPARCLK